MNANAYYRNDAFQELKAAVERYRAQDPVGLQANVAAAVAIAAVAIRYVDSVPTKARRPRRRP